jgi:asparagine synthase (glutamine-hydrolysing)
MRSQLLRDTDVMSMAHSLEVRVPLVDREVVRSVLPHLAQPARGDGYPKWLLRQSLCRGLSSSVVSRRKQGFVFPWQEWLGGEVSRTVDGMLSASGRWSPFLCLGSVGSLCADYVRGRAHWSSLWAVFVASRFMV